MVVSLSGTPLAICKEDEDLFEYVDLLFSEDLAEFAFEGTLEAARGSLIATKRPLVVCRDGSTSACLDIFMRFEENECKKFTYQVSATSDPSAESGFVIQGPALSTHLFYDISFLSGVKFKDYLKAVANRGFGGLENEELELAIRELHEGEKSKDRPPFSLSAYPLMRINAKGEPYLSVVQMKQQGASFRLWGPAGQKGATGTFSIHSITAALAYLASLKKRLPGRHIFNECLYEAGCSVSSERGREGRSGV